MGERVRNWEVIQANYKTYAHDRLKNDVIMLSKSEVGMEQLNDFGQKQLAYQTERVASACEVMGVKNVDLYAVLGPKGVGKDTQDEAFMRAAAMFTSEYLESFSDVPKGLKKILRRYSEATKKIRTGTKGMLYKPEGEYKHYTELASKVGTITQSGGYVSDEFTTVLVYGEVATAITDGYTSFEINLHPRTGGQHEHDMSLFSLLGDPELMYGENVEANLDLMYLAKMDDETFDKINAARGEYAAAAGIISSQMEEWFEVTKAELEQLPNEGLREEAILEKLEQFREGDEKMNYFADMVQVSIERSRERRKADGKNSRSDDNPVPTFNRVMNDVSAIAYFWGNEKVALVSASGDADQVSQNMVEAMMDGEDMDSPAVREFIRIVGEQALQVVAENSSK